MSWVWDTDVVFDFYNTWARATYFGMFSNFPFFLSSCFKLLFVRKTVFLFFLLRDVDRCTHMIQDSTQELEKHRYNILLVILNQNSKTAVSYLAAIVNAEPFQLCAPYATLK